MNKSVFILTAALALTACKSEKVQGGEEKKDSVATPSRTPISLANEQAAQIDTVLGGSRYNLLVQCMADKSVPPIEDELGQLYYNNKVVVKVGKEGGLLLEKTFTKADFETYLSGVNTKAMILQGMNFYLEDSGKYGICLIAQIGEPGLDGGHLFWVKVDKNNGSLSIEKSDWLMDETEPMD